MPDARNIFHGNTAGSVSGKMNLKEGQSLIRDRPDITVLVDWV